MRPSRPFLPILVALLALGLPNEALSGFFTPRTTKVTSEAVLNGSFEAGRNQGWNEASAGYAIVVPVANQTRTGSWLAILGQDESAVETLSQDVIIPADAQDARFTFWYRILTEEGTTITVYDRLRITAMDVATGTVLSEQTLSNADQSAEYQQSVAVSLAEYRGRSVRLSFNATADSSLITNFRIDDVSLLVTRVEPILPTSNYSDIWWNPNESGWGLTIADHETQLFAVWYTYRQDGSPTWFVIPGGTFAQGRRLFNGDMYQTTGPRYDVPFNPNSVTLTLVGNISLDFAPPGLPPGTALFSYTVGSVTGSKQIQRQPFGNAAPNWGADFTDIWWNPNESGWGLTLAQHGDNVFGVWFTYDTNGQPLFVVMPGVAFSGLNSFSGALFTTRGPYFGAAFDASRLQVTPAGTASLEAQVVGGQPRMRFRPVIFGSAMDKQVQRQPFGSSQPNVPQPQNHTLTVTFLGDGTGRVVSSPAGIDCPGRCSATYAPGTNVTLTATASGTSRFAQFSGGCSSSAFVCTVATNAATAVNARFDLLRPTSTLAIHPQTLPPFIPGQPYRQLAATADGGEQPYTFSLDSFATGAPPIGLNVDFQGFLTGTPNASTAQELFTFGICVQDRVGTRVCTANSVSRQQPQQPAAGTCRGTGTITVSGHLRAPGQPFCQGSLPLTSPITIEIEMGSWNHLGTQQAQVRINKAHWICQNDAATAVSTFFPPQISLSAGSGTTVNGVGTSSDSGGRFDISFSMNETAVSGAISRTYLQADLGADWSWTGTFSCSR